MLSPLLGLVLALEVEGSWPGQWNFDLKSDEEHHVWTGRSILSHRGAEVK